MRALALLLSLAACATPRPIVVAPAAPPAPPPVVIIKRVVVIRHQDRPDAYGAAILHAYANLRPTVDQVVVASKKPAAIDHLTTLDRHVRMALEPFRRSHHKPTAAEVEAAIASLTELRVAAAATAKGP